MNLKFKKTIAFVTALLFISNTLAYSAPALPDLTLLSPQTPRKEALLPVLELEIPGSLGKVEHLSQAQGNTGFVIHIQDAHGSYQAQKNIRLLLNYLKKRYGIKLVFLEGGASALNPQYFHFFKDKRRNQRIARRLMRKGVLSGAEAFLIEQGEAEGFGIENVGVYRQDIGLFRKVLSRHPETRKFLQTEERHARLLETKIMSRRLRKFLKAWRDYRKESSSLLRFMGILENEAQKTLGLNLKDPVHQNRFPSLLRILKVKKLEDALDRDKAAEEREALIRSLETKLGEKGKTWLEPLRTLDKSKNPRLVFEKIFEKAGSVDFGPYSHFKQYAQYLIFQSEIDGPEIFQEIETLCSEIFSRLAKTEDDKILIEAERQIAFLEKLFALELTRAEYRQILNMPFEPSSLSGSINLLSQKYGSFDTTEDLNSCDRIFDDALTFYRLAEEREQHFIGALFRVMKEKQNDRAVIVTGGFHSEGITEQFEKKGISYAEISPRLKPDKKGRELYLETMLGSAAYQKAYIANVLKIQPIETQNAMAAMLDEIIPAVLDQVMEEGRRAGEGREAVLRLVAQSDYGKQLSFRFGKSDAEILFGGRRLAYYQELSQAASLGAQAEKLSGRSLGGEAPLEKILDLLNRNYPEYTNQDIYALLIAQSTAINRSLNHPLVGMVTALWEMHNMKDATIQPAFTGKFNQALDEFNEVLIHHGYRLDYSEGTTPPFSLVQAQASSLGQEAVEMTSEEREIRKLLKGANEVLNILDGKQAVTLFQPVSFAAKSLAVSLALIGGAWILSFFALPDAGRILRWGVTAVIGPFALGFAFHLAVAGVKNLIAKPWQENWGELADRFAEGARRLQDLYDVRKSRQGGQVDFELPWGRRDEIPWDQVFLHAGPRGNQALVLAGEHVQTWAQHMHRLSKEWFEEWQGRGIKMKPVKRDAFFQAIHDALLLGAGRFRAKFLLEEVEQSKAFSDGNKFIIKLNLTRIVQNTEDVLRPWLRIATSFPFPPAKVTVTENYGPAFSDAVSNFRHGMEHVAGLLAEGISAEDAGTGASLGTESQAAEELFRAMREEPIQGGARHHEDLSFYLAALGRGEAVKGISRERYLDMVDYVSNHLARILLAAVPPSWPLSAEKKQAFKKLLLKNIREFRKLGMYPLTIQAALVRITPVEARVTLDRLKNTVIGVSPEGREVKLDNAESQVILFSALKNRANALSYVDNYVKGLQEAYKAAVKKFLEIRKEIQPRITALTGDSPEIDRQKLLIRNRENASIHNIARSIASLVYTSPEPAFKAAERVNTIFSVADHLLSKDSEPRITPGSAWMMAVRASEHEDPYATADIFASRWQRAYAMTEALDVAAKNAAADQFYTSKDWEAKTRMALKYYALAKTYAAELGYQDLAGSLAGVVMFEKSEDAVKALVDRLAAREKKAREAAQTTELQKVQKSVGGHAVAVGKGAEDFKEAVTISLERERKIQERRRKERKEWLAELTVSERFKTMTTVEVEKSIRDAVQELTDQNKAQGLEGERAKPTAAEVETKLGLNAGNLFNIMRYRRYRLDNSAFPNFTEFGIRPEGEWFNLEEPAVLEKRIREVIVQLTEKNIAEGKSRKKGVAKPTIAEVAWALEITPERLMNVVSRRRHRGTILFPSLIEMGAKRDRGKPPAQAASLGEQELQKFLEALRFSGMGLDDSSDIIDFDREFAGIQQEEILTDAALRQVRASFAARDLRSLVFVGLPLAEDRWISVQRLAQELFSLIHGQYATERMQMAPILDPQQIESYENAIKDAITNAVIWGNRNVPRNAIAIRWNFEGDKLLFDGIDQGLRSIDFADRPEPPAGVHGQFHGTNFGRFYVEKYLIPQYRLAEGRYDRPLTGPQGERLGQMVSSQFPLSGVPPKGQSLGFEADLIPLLRRIPREEHGRRPRMAPVDIQQAMEKYLPNIQFLLNKGFTLDQMKAYPGIVKYDPQTKWEYLTTGGTLARDGKKYKKLGISEKIIRQYPYLLQYNLDKLSETWEFLTKKLGIPESQIRQIPKILGSGIDKLALTWDYLTGTRGDSVEDGKSYPNLGIPPDKVRKNPILLTYSLANLSQTWNFLTREQGRTLYEKQHYANLGFPAEKIQQEPILLAAGIPNLAATWDFLTKKGGLSEYKGTQYPNLGIPKAKARQVPGLLRLTPENLSRKWIFLTKPGTTVHEEGSYPNLEIPEANVRKNPMLLALGIDNLSDTFQFLTVQAKVPADALRTNTYILMAALDLGKTAYSGLRMRAAFFTTRKIPFKNRPYILTASQGKLKKAGLGQRALRDLKRFNLEKWKPREETIAAVKNINQAKLARDLRQLRILSDDYLYFAPEDQRKNLKLRIRQHIGTLTQHHFPGRALSAERKALRRDLKEAALARAASMGDEDPSVKVLTQYDLGEISRVVPLEKGLSGQAVWRVESGLGKFVLMEKTVRNHSDFIRWESSLYAGLHRRGFDLVPSMIATRSGSIFADHDGKFYVLYDYKHGERLPWGAIQGEKLAQTAKTQARYHEAVMTVVPEGRNTDVASRLYPLADLLNLGEMRQWFKRARDDLPSDLGLATSRETLFDFIESQITKLEQNSLARHYERLPQLVIHGDYNSNNLLFTGDQISGVIDFDYARQAPRILDLANGSIPIDWNQNPPDTRFLTDYLRAYQAEARHKLSREEVLALEDAYRANLLEGIALTFFVAIRRPDIFSEHFIRILENNLKNFEALNHIDWEALADSAQSLGDEPDSAQGESEGSEDAEKQPVVAAQHLLPYVDQAYAAVAAVTGLAEAEIRSKIRPENIYLVPSAALERGVAIGMWPTLSEAINEMNIREVAEWIRGSGDLIRLGTEILSDFLNEVTLQGPGELVRDLREWIPPRAAEVLIEILMALPPAIGVLLVLPPAQLEQALEELKAWLSRREALLLEIFRRIPSAAGLNTHLEILINKDFGPFLFRRTLIHEIFHSVTTGFRRSWPVVLLSLLDEGAAEFYARRAAALSGGLLGKILVNPFYLPGFIVYHVIEKIVGPEIALRAYLEGNSDLLEQAFDAQAGEGSFWSISKNLEYGLLSFFFAEGSPLTAPIKAAADAARIYFEVKQRRQAGGSTTGSPGNGTRAESLGEINPALLDEMRMNLDPRWGPDAEKLWQKNQRQELWTAADNALYEKILGRYNRIVKSDDTEYARHPEIARAIKGSTVMASTMEAMLSGTRLNGEVDVAGEVGELWRSMDGKLEDSAHLDELARAIGNLKSRVIEGKFVSNFNGGLGVLTGDEFGAWADLGVPSSLSAADEKEKGNFLAFGLFYKQGVFVSSVDAKGRQRKAGPLAFPFKNQKIENPVTETLRYPAGHGKAGHDVVLQIPLQNGHTGKVKVEVAKVGRVKMLLFNPDILENDHNPLFREVLSTVYKGDVGSDERFIQEWILGVGTIALIKEFGLNPGALHLNESATAFALPALMKYYMDKEGVDDEEALQLASNNLVFTTHTLEPEALGHYSQDTFPIDKYFNTLFGDEETARWFLEKATENEDIYPAKWLIQQAKRRNAVSTLNAREATRNFGKPFDGITNGVRRPFWQAEKLQDLIETLPSGVDDLLDPKDPGHRGMWEELNPGRPVALGAKGVPDETLRDNKLEMKKRMIGLVRLYKAEALIQDIKEWEAKNERDRPRLAKHPDVKLAAKVAQREERLKVMRERLKNIPQLLDENKLTLTWARRIVGYKRLFFAMTGEFLPEIEEKIEGGNLSDEDIERLVISLKERGAFDKFKDLIARGAQFIFAGKTHPKNKEGLATLRMLYYIIQHFGWEQSVVYVPGYDERLAKALVQGSDIWFASSEVPREASGTSGQKAMMNGTVLLSTNDGFARDGVEHRMNGLIYGKEKAPPVDAIARKQYVADEHASWHQIMGEALAMHGSQDLRAWSNLMRASIYYSSRVFSMEGVELGRIVPPEGRQPGYFDYYAGAARDIARELFLTQFKKAEPHVQIKVLSKKPGYARSIFTARIPHRVSFDPSNFDYYFWYGKKTDLEWKPLPAKAQVVKGGFRIFAMVDIPQENQAADYGVTYFAVPKGTQVMGVSKDLWGLGKAIWRTRTNGQDIYFQVPAASARGASLGDEGALARDLRKPEFVKFEGILEADAEKQKWVRDFLAAQPDKAAKVSPFLQWPNTKSFLYIRSVEKPKGLGAWWPGKKAKVRMEVHEDGRSPVLYLDFTSEQTAHEGFNSLLPAIDGLIGLQRISDDKLREYLNAKAGKAPSRPVGAHAYQALDPRQQAAEVEIIWQLLQRNLVDYLQRLRKAIVDSHPPEDLHLPDPGRIAQIILGEPDLVLKGKIPGLGIYADDDSLWILKERKAGDLSKGEWSGDKTSPEREMLGHLLLSAYANAGEVRSISPQDQGLPPRVLMNPGNYYFVRLVKEGNVPQAAVKSANRGKSFSALMAANVLMRKHDSHFINHAFLGENGNIPASIDNSFAFRNDVLHLREYQFEMFKYNYILNTLFGDLFLITDNPLFSAVEFNRKLKEKFITIRNALGGQFESPMQQEVTVMGIIQDLIQEAQATMRRFGTGDALLKALEIDSAELKAAILNLKRIPEAEIREYLQQAGYAPGKAGYELEPMVAFIRGNQKTLGRGVNELLKLIAGKDFALDKLDESDSQTGFRYRIANDKQKQQVYEQVSKEYNAGRRKYYERFMKGLEKAGSQLKLTLPPDSVIDRAKFFGEGLVVEKIGEREYHFVLRKRDRQTRTRDGLLKDSRSPERERMAYLLGENLAEIRFLTKEDALQLIQQGMPLDVKYLSDYYLERVITEENTQAADSAGTMQSMLPIQDPGEALASFLVFNLLARRLDAHIGNISYAGGIPVSRDNDQALRADKMVHALAGYQAEANFHLFLFQYAINALFTPVYFLTNQEAFNPEKWDLHFAELVRQSEGNPAVALHKILREVKAVIDQQKLGAGWLNAEMTGTGENVMKKIKRYQELRPEQVRQFAQEAYEKAGFSGRQLEASVEAMVLFVTKNQNRLEHDMNKLFFFTTGQNLSALPDRQGKEFGASLGERSDFRVREFLVGEGRSLDSVLEVAIRLTDGVLWIKGNPEVLRRLMEKLGLFKKAENTRTENSFGSRFNDGKLDQPVRDYLGKGTDRKNVRGNMPFILFDKVLDMDSGLRRRGQQVPVSVPESWDSGQVSQAVKEFAGQLEHGDFVAVVWKNKIPAFFGELNQIKREKNIEVRAVREELAGSTLPHWMKSYRGPAVVVSTVDEGVMELHVKGEKVALNLEELNQAGINPIKVLALLRQIGDDTEAYAKLGFMMDQEKGFWVVGAQFAEVIREIDAKHQAMQVTERAA